MIKKIADILRGFMNEEASKLAKYNLKHAPTIGTMYEGLSAEILNKAIPPELNLQVVDGFITDGKDYLSGQIDCMLVRGAGENVPYTDSFKWHVKDVLAVFEVKKNLYSKELIDSFYKLRQATESYSEYLFNGTEERNKTIDLEPSYRKFSQLTGIAAPKYHDREQLSLENQLIYTTIFMEQLTPLKIVIGYDGFSSEYGLREGLVKFIEEKGVGHGYGVPAFPNLIICGEHSLIKATGHPYIAPMRDGYWDFMLSSKYNPILLMLELIWTKLSLEFDIKFHWGDGLEEEVLNEFLRAKAVFNGAQGGWMLKYDEISKETLDARKSTIEWQPVEVSLPAFTIFQRLCYEDVSISAPNFIEFAIKECSSVTNLVDELLSTNCVALDGNNITLITERLGTIITPDGKYMVAEDNSGQLTAWVNSTYNPK
ncbi:hypothetical protein OR620_06945 [Aeromonas hydrophila]|uniref:DUF6602 domain-containing protein n=1 Tax=Aeromonas TaxID=642 RepID=UPI00111AE374|nr:MULTISPECIES: DUF6602 domain-containing protein [Aeromonas]MCX4103512.1 hypothetical protein [Aeromonas hydrophila]